MTMTARPNWLPETVCVDGEYNQVLVKLYEIFEKDIKHTILRLNGVPVWYDRRLLPGDKYEEGFWHLTSRDELVFDKKLKRNVLNRVWDPRRSERLPWCRPTIDNFKEIAVLTWDFREARGQVRTYLWLKKYDYVVVLEKQSKRLGPIYMLITAFYVDYASKRRDLETRYLNRLGPK
jgi:hypothetical protein